jgi:uncharacterized protein (TIGR03067 family)
VTEYVFLTKNSGILQDAAQNHLARLTLPLSWLVEAPMRRPLVCLALLIVITTAAASAQDPSAALQGRWVVTGGEHNGKPMDSLNGGVMTITGNAFEIRTASGNILKGTLRLDPSKTPLHMDMIHADGAQWEAIYETTADTLRLNYVVKGEKDPRPASFKTSEATEESLIVLQREKR